MSGRRSRAEDARPVIDLTGPPDEIAGPVGALAVAWLAHGVPVPTASPARVYRCSITSCKGLPFVRLTTPDGASDLCLCHFEQVKARTRYLSRCSQ